LARFDASIQTNSEIHFSVFIHLGGNQSFSQCRFLSEDDAAVFARAFIFDLFERSFSNRVGHFAFDTEIFAACGLGFDCAAYCGISGKRLYGNERRNFPRIQFNCVVSQIASANYLNCLGLLVRSPEKP
jgi:hypothetical protein